MITTAEQYNASLHLLNNTNPPTYAALPTADNIYNIDIKTREIDAPQFLAVERDNVAETVYFIIDRFANYIDLATTSCIITYTNALGKSRLYAVPFYDIYTFASEKKMVIPWCLDLNVAEAPGKVEFAIQFFKVGETFNTTTNTTEKILSYVLNTLPATSMVLTGIDVKEFEEEYQLKSNQFEDLVELMNNTLSSYTQTTWTFLD